MTTEPDWHCAAIMWEGLSYQQHQQLKLDPHISFLTFCFSRSIWKPITGITARKRQNCLSHLKKWGFDQSSCVNLSGFCVLMYWDFLKDRLTNTLKLLNQNIQRSNMKTIQDAFQLITDGLDERVWICLFVLLLLCVLSRHESGWIYLHWADFIHVLWPSPAQVLVERSVSSSFMLQYPEHRSPLRVQRSDIKPKMIKLFAVCPSNPEWRPSSCSASESDVSIQKGRFFLTLNSWIISNSPTGGWWWRQTKDMMRWKQEKVSTDLLSSLSDPVFPGRGAQTTARGPDPHRLLAK